jgi:hypothetical protein
MRFYKDEIDMNAFLIEIAPLARTFTGNDTDKELKSELTDL